MRDAGLKSETCHYKTKFGRRNFFILIRKSLHLLKSLASSHSERTYRELGLWPGSVPGSQPLGLPSHFSLAAQLCQNTLWGQPPATAASIFPKVGGYMRNTTQPWAVLWFAPKILQGHYATFLPQIHLLSALEGHSVSTRTCKETVFAFEENRDRWCVLEKISLSQRGEDHHVEGLLSAGIRRDPKSTQLLWKYLHPNTSAKPQRAFTGSKISLGFKVQRSLGF